MKNLLLILLLINTGCASTVSYRLTANVHTLEVSGCQTENNYRYEKKQLKDLHDCTIYVDTKTKKIDDRYMLCPMKINGEPVFSVIVEYFDSKFLCETERKRTSELLKKQKPLDNPDIKYIAKEAYGVDYDDYE